MHIGRIKIIFPIDLRDFFISKELEDNSGEAPLELDPVALSQVLLRNLINLVA
jgi:hypothetical protein